MGVCDCVYMIVCVCCMSVCVLQVNGQLYDLERPLEGDCSLEILKFDDDEGDLPHASLSKDNIV